MPRPDLRIGIVSWNTAPLLDRCLAALPAALGSLRAEVVVVDNASDDDSVAVATRWGVVVREHDRNLGYAVAMNEALAATEAPVLVALNPDAELPPGSLERLVAALDAHPIAGVVVPRLLDPDGGPQHSARRLPTPVPTLVSALATPAMARGAIGRRLLLDGSGAHPAGAVPWAIGAVHVIRAAALDGEQPYVERSFMYAEDLELCWRLGQRGWTTWLEAEVEVPHVGNAAGARAWGDARSLRYWAATYDVVALRRSAGAARLLGAVATLAALIAVVRALPGAWQGDDRAAQRGLIRLRLREAAVHARAALLGPPPPPTSPPA
jgi:N-acetylglucosaminyl-diphospho-decaprenol L-rhamnosyltransferase